ncbi:hypothetical protein [Singulisphaera acidiphila]|uniref:Uncharacterized protein n=1 Tax=Singulisphaera acidiphila (strain ATCC BAA-1392 / DSM 18658 / VKM B-2454 / MOB10) TaxID=886293 RepID=L0DDA3_SINAD|nr:hypothetical protein [Singulisphaera acidiphila]AGA27232.1 hypothetical protein Sinac_2948 [Singulisphaera acidiphila DSM 18658]
MRNLQIAISTLERAGYSQPSQANAFYPANNQDDHIHLGVPTSYLDGTNQRFAEPGNVFVTYISLKKDGVFWFKLLHDDVTGYFSFPEGKGMDDLPVDWRRALEALNMIQSHVVA